MTAGSYCAYCGLPMAARKLRADEDAYCCYGCYLVSRIVRNEDQQGLHSWNLLRLSLGALLAMNVMMISLLLYTGAVEPGAVPLFRWALLGLSTPAMLILAVPFAAGALREIQRRRLSLDTLIAAGSWTAFAASAVHVAQGAGHIYFDTATMLPVLVTFGKFIEATAKSRTGRLVRGLETLLPATVRRLEADGVRDVALDALRAGDRLQVLPGGKIPADGRILEGRTTIEEAAFTGESLPRACGPGDQVIAGTVNGAGGLVIAAERVGSQLLLRRIIDMVEEARAHTSPFERLAERAATLFIPAVLVLAIGAGVCWTIASGLAQGALVALAVVVVACPCALGLATPLATALAIGRAARAGIVVRGGDLLERIGRIDLMFFDKTGTLTAGQPSLRAVEPLDPSVSESELLAWLAGLESGSEHSLARAIVAAAQARGLDIGQAANVRADPGRGVRGTVSRNGVTHEVLAGTSGFVAGAGTAPQPSASAHATTAVYVAWDDQVRGRVLLADAVRPEAAAAVRRLHAAAIPIVLLSGDRADIAALIGNETGIDRIEAPRLPGEKIELIRTAMASGATVAMVGDGLNDAPALTAAAVGIALGAGTDLARQAGNVILLSNRLTQIPWLVALSRRTRRIILQNLLWALGYNSVALAAAAAGVLHPLLAAVAMVVSSLTLLGNSARLQRFPDDAA